MKTNEPKQIMYNGKVIHAIYCSQMPEHIGTHNQQIHCQKYFRAIYKTNYKYTAATFQGVETKLLC